MILSYTKEMKKQDRLLEEGRGDIVITKKLYLEIMKEAKEKGFDGSFDIYEYRGEALLDIFENKEESKTGETTKFELCQPAIDYLEYLSSDNNLEQEKTEEEIKMEINKEFKCECGGELQLVEAIDGFFTYKLDKEGKFSWENKEFHGDSSLNLQCTVCNKEYECELDEDVEEKVNILK